MGKATWPNRVVLPVPERLSAQWWECGRSSGGAFAIPYHTIKLTDGKPTYRLERRWNEVAEREIKSPVAGSGKGYRFAS